MKNPNVIKAGVVGTALVAALGGCSSKSLHFSLDTSKPEATTSASSPAPGTPNYPHVVDTRYNPRIVDGLPVSDGSHADLYSNGTITIFFHTIDQPSDADPFKIKFACDDQRRIVGHAEAPIGATAIHGLSNLDKTSAPDAPECATGGLTVSALDELAN